MRSEADAAEMQQLSEMIFEGFADTFGMNQEQAEVWGARTHQTLLLLLHDNYRDDEREFYQQTEAYVQVVETLLDHPHLEQMIGKGGVRILSEGIGKVIDRANEAIVAQISETEIALFCILAEGGRTIFSDAKKNPDDFVPKDVYLLARQIKENYAAYEETLQGLRA